MLQYTATCDVNMSSVSTIACCWGNW